MKNTIQNTIIGVFTLIGVFTIVSGFTPDRTNEQTPFHGTPESHVWDIYQMDTGERHYNWLLNRKTGEVWDLKKNGTKELVTEK